MKCTICTQEFESKRADAKFCSSTCRSRAKRNATDNLATDNSVQDATDKEIRIDGKLVVGYGQRRELIMRGDTVREVILHQDGEPMFFCPKHSNHVVSYCSGMCVSSLQEQECQHV